ncbi:polyprenyl synthetase family protein [Amycolatopsis sp. lyj-90]|uniref:polyprenyl synthetase family protein n=1 Tax=Amycolatopsis sp. lyj-90 TaxID=2789285 RepID=UPI00397DB39C
MPFSSTAPFSLTSRGSDDRDRVVKQLLTDTGQRVTPPLRAAVESLAGNTALVAGCHFGWLDRAGRPAEARGGKMLRPALTLLCAQAVGGQAEDAITGAVAVELAHAFSLLHYDVMDCDRTRRRRSSIWASFGVPTAILTGDALFGLALRVIAGSGNPGAFDELSMAVREMITGQGADLAFEARADITIPEYLAMAAGKTGALLGGACALGARLGGGTGEQISCLRAFGEQLGVAFQAAEDVLGIRGDGRDAGKTIGSDLMNCKKTLPVVVALASKTAAGRELGRLYELGRPLSTDEVRRAVIAVETAGGPAWAEREAEWQRVGAVSRLYKVGLVPEGATALTDLARFVVRRDH